MTYHYLPKPGDVVAYEDPHGVRHTQRATEDTAEAIAYNPRVILLEAALDGAISDVLTSANMVKDGRYLQ